MKYAFACREQIVRNNSAMASPPHRLGTHDRARRAMTELAQCRKTGAEALAHGVVRVVMETLILPESVDIFGDVRLVSAQAAQGRDVPVSDLKFRQRVGQR